MAIYQAPRKRWRLTLFSALIGALVGLGIGLIASGGDADPTDVLKQLDAELEEAAAPLDVLVIHGEADTGSSTDARVVTDALARTTQRFDEVRAAVRIFNSGAVEDFDRHVARLEELVRDEAGAAEIAEGAEALAALLRGIVRA